MPAPIFLYGFQSPIEVSNVDTLEAGIKFTVLTIDNGKLPKDLDLYITVDLPTYTPDNIVPVKTKIDAAVFLQAFAHYADDAGNKINRNSVTMVGVPVNHPQRRKKHKKNLKHQTFKFVQKAHTVNSVIFVVQSIHRFFKTDVKTARYLRLKSAPVPVAT